MIFLLPLLALLAPVTTLQSAPPEPTPQQVAPQLSLEHRMLVRCSAAFAMVAHGQAAGQQEVQRYPAMRERGQDFFVRASAQVMDEASLDREQIAAALSTEAQDLWDSDTLDDVMPACLALLPSE